jgi:hypothetical protein
MTRKFRWLAVAALIMAGCGGTDTAQLGNDTRDSAARRPVRPVNTFCSGQTIEVWAGVGNANAGTLVGYLTLSGGTATLTLPEGSPYVPTVMHLAFGATLADIPVNNSGNPVPGQFPYQFPISSPPYTFEFAAPSGTVYAAAHFVFVQPGGVQGFQLLLPSGMVDLSVTMPYPGGPAYFPHTYLTNAGAMSGDYLGWCSDVGRLITPDVTYPAKLYSTYDAAGIAELAALLPPTTFHAESLPKVNYLLNQFQVGTMVAPVDDATSCTPTGAPAEALTYSDIQKAIWWLISNDTAQNGGLDVWSQQRVDAIVCAANANSSFTPACGQKVAFLAVPLTGDPPAISNQPVLATAPAPCGGGEETAWADGKVGAIFPGASQWGTYFQWNTACTAD